MEKEDGISSNHYTAEYWMYDSRLGRRWNIDPLASYFPGVSPYACFLNNPIIYVDPNGLKATPWQKVRGAIKSFFFDIGLAKNRSIMGRDRANGAKRRINTTNKDAGFFNNHHEGHSQESELEEEIKSPAVLEEIPKSIEAKVPFQQNTNLFESNLTAANELDPVGDLMKRHSSIKVTVTTNVAIGENDSRDINSLVRHTTDGVTFKRIPARELMKLRAKAIKDYLVQYGIDSDRIDFKEGEVLIGTPGLNSTIIVKP